MLRLIFNNLRRPARPNSRISEEYAATVLPDSILSTMLEQDVISGPYKPPHPLVRRPARWTWVTAAIAVSLATVALIKGFLA
jgi:hypothetical protein